MAMRSHLAAGKSRLKDKLKTIEELKTRISQYVSNLTEQPTEAALQLLEETDRGRFFKRFSSVSEELEKCLDTLFLLSVSLNNDEGDGFDGPLLGSASSDSSDSIFGAAKRPQSSGKTDDVHEDRRKRHSTERTESGGVVESESGLESEFSFIQTDSGTLEEESSRQDESVTIWSSSDQSSQSSFVQTKEEETGKQKDSNTSSSSDRSHSSLSVETGTERAKDKSSNILSSPEQPLFSLQMQGNTDNTPSSSAQSHSSLSVQTGAEMGQAERVEDGSTSVLYFPAQPLVSLQTQSNTENFKQNRVKQEDCPTIVSPHVRDHTGHSVQTNTDREERARHEIAPAILSVQNKPDSFSMPVDDAVKENSEISKAEVPPEHCNDVGNEEQNMLHDVAECHLLSKEAAVSEQVHGGSVFGGNIREELTNASDEALVPVHNFGQETEYKGLADTQQELEQKDSCSTLYVDTETLKPVTGQLWLSAEEVPLPSDTDSDPLSSPAQQASLNTSRCSDDCPAQERETSLPLREAPLLVNKPGTDMKESTPEVCGIRRRIEDSNAEGQSIAETIDHFSVEKDLDELHVTEERNIGDGDPGEQVFETIGANEVVGTISSASSTNNLEETLASQHSEAADVLSPPLSCSTPSIEEGNSYQSDLEAEPECLSPTHVQETSPSVPVLPLCHSSPVHTSPSDNEDHTETEPQETDGKREEETIAPRVCSHVDKFDENCVKTEPSPNITISEAETSVSVIHTIESDSSVSSLPVSQSSPLQTPACAKQPLLADTDRLSSSGENCTESHPYQSMEEEQGTSTDILQDTKAVYSVSSSQSEYPVQTDLPSQSLPTSPVLSPSQKSSDQASLYQNSQVPKVPSVSSCQSEYPVQTDLPRRSLPASPVLSPSQKSCDQQDTKAVSSVSSCQSEYPVPQQPLLGSPVLPPSHKTCDQPSLFQYPQVPGPKVPSLTFSNGDTLDVVVSEILDPSHFWVQPAGDQLNLLTEQLSLFYEKSSLPPGLPYMPMVGMFCAACFTEDNTWYRGRITAVHSVEGTGIAELLSPSSQMPGPEVLNAPQTDVDILYVDYGNRERLSLSRVKELHEQFTHLPCQALCCGLAKVMPFDNSNSWTSQQRIWLARQMIGKKLQAVFDLDPSRHSTKVDLYYTIPGVQNSKGQRSERRISISELMIAEKMAVAQNLPHRADEDVSREVVQSRELMDKTPRSPTVAKPAQQRILNHDKMLQDQAQVQRLLQQQQEELQLRRQKSCQTANPSSAGGKKKNKDANSAEKSAAQTSTKHPKDKAAGKKPKDRESSKGKIPTSAHDDMEAMVKREMGITDGQGCGSVHKDWTHEKADSSIDEYLDSLATVPQPTENGHPVTPSIKGPSDVGRSKLAKESGTLRTKDAKHDLQAKRCGSSDQKPADIISPQWKRQINNLSKNERKVRKTSGATRGRKIPSSSGSTTSEEDDLNWWREDGVQKQGLQKNNDNTEQNSGRKCSDARGCGGTGGVEDETDCIQLKKPVVKLNEDGSFLLMTSYIVDPSEFYVHMVTPDATKIDQLKKELNLFYQQKADMLRKITFEPCGNDMCCARFSEDKTWYRAQICSVTYARGCSATLSAGRHGGRKEQRSCEAERLDCSEVQVHYVDYGNFERLPVSEVLPLMPEFTEMPAHAVKCSLYGIKPTTEQVGDWGPKSVWSQEASTTFANLTPFDRTLVGYVQKPKAHSEVQPPLQLLLVDRTGPVEVCINDQLVRCGVASYVPSPVPPPPTKSKARDDESKDDDLNGLDGWDPQAVDYLSERNSYFVDVDNAEVATVGYKSKAIPRCKFFRPGVQCWKGDNCPNLHLQHGEVKVPEKQPVFCRDHDHIVELPPVQSQVAVEVTAIFNPKHFYIQFTYGGVPHNDLLDMANNGRSDHWEWTKHNKAGLQAKWTAADGVDVDKPNPLDELMKEMNDHYSKKVYSEREPGIVLSVAQIVVAEYSKDNQFYRARVVDVDPENQRVKVFYVDYGNVETIPESAVYDIEPQFNTLPYQAIECFMANIEPLPSDGGKPRWSKTARDVFDDLVVGKVLIAHVLSRGFDNTLYVSLFDTTAEQDTRIDYALVEAGLARRVNIYREQPAKERMVGHMERLAPG